MTINLDELETRAKAATPGPWLIERRDMGSGEIIHVVYGTHDVTWSGDEACPNARGDARYIAAASPDVVLALIARVRELEDTIEGLRADLRGEDD